MTVEFTFGIGELAALLGSFCAILGAISAIIMFAIRMIVRSEISSLKDSLNDKYQTREACSAIRRECEKHRHLQLGLVAAAGHPHDTIGGHNNP